jgi:hypothetical protein
MVFYLRAKRLLKRIDAISEEPEIRDEVHIVRKYKAKVTHKKPPLEELPKEEKEEEDVFYFGEDNSVNPPLNTSSYVSRGDDEWVFGEEELTRQVATQVIKNLIKTRNLLGFELLAAYEDLPDDEFEKILTEEGLERNNITLAEFSKYVSQLQHLLPDIEWGEETIADALFCERHKVNKLIKQFNSNSEIIP